MIVVLKGVFWEFDIGISKYSIFESRQFQSISAKFSDWGSLCSPQFEASDYGRKGLYPPTLYVYICIHQYYPALAFIILLQGTASSRHKGPYSFDRVTLAQDMSGEHSGPVWAIKFSPCGRLMATGRICHLSRAC